MRRLWMANALLATTWVLGSGYYQRPQWLLWLAVLFAALALLGNGLVRLPSSGVAGVSALMLAPACWVAPWPHKAGLLLLLAGLVIQSLFPARNQGGRIASATLLAGFILIAQTVALEAYESITARLPDLPGALTHGLAALLRLVGAEATVDGQCIVLYSLRQTQRLAATWNLVLDPASFGFLAGGGVLALAIGKCFSARAGHQTLQPGTRPRPESGHAAAGDEVGEVPPGPISSAGAVSLVLFVMALWLPIRALLIVGVFLHRTWRLEQAGGGLVTQFWNPWVLLVFLVPPAMALAFVFKRRFTSNAEPAATATAPASVAPKGAGGFLISGALVCLAVLLGVVALTWHPAGRRSAGRILVDDYHSGQPWPQKDFDTTATGRPYDTNWWGKGSSYNYATAFAYAGHFYSVSRLTEPISAAAIENSDVLVLKDPASAYSDAEIEAVLAFVQRGGGVLLIGDHTTVFGSGAHLNKLASYFGFRYRYDTVYGFNSSFGEKWHPPRPPHPACQHASEFQFLTSCTIDPGLSRGQAVIRGRGFKSLDADYNIDNYIPQRKDTAQTRAGAFPLLWGTDWGSGRVLAFTDSTVFSGFAVFERGKSELLIGMLEWLNHRPPPGTPRRWILAAALLTALAAAWATAEGRPHQAWVVSTATLGWFLGASVVTQLHRAAVPFPPCRTPFVRLSVDQTVSAARFPREDAQGRSGPNFGEFEQCAVRLGYVPRRTSRLDDTFGNDAVIVLWPNARDQARTSEFGTRLERYVLDGGKVLLVDAPENAQSLANTLLHPFGLSVEPLRAPKKHRPGVPPGWPAPAIDSAWIVKGGEPLATIAGNPVAAWKQHGKGLVAVVGFGSRLSDPQMRVDSRSDRPPEGETRAALDYVFSLLRWFVELGLADSQPGSVVKRSPAPVVQAPPKDSPEEPKVRE